jgi:DNA-binding beta-propeller fold protein YncE
MKIVCCLFLVFFFGAALGKVEAEENSPLRFVQTIPLPKVAGRIDHMAVDVKGQRLFIAALGNNTVEILDLNAGKHFKSISGFHEPQGVSFIPEFNKLLVANAKTGACDILDGSSFEHINSVKFRDDADNIRYDTNGQRVYVGYGNGGLGIIDAKTGNHIGDIRLDAHPESFQLERSGARIFINLPDAKKIAVVNRETRTTITKWATADATANFPMALDETHQRLFVGFRKPAKLTVYDTDSGKIVGNLDTVGDADDIFYDGSRQRIYIAGGDGFLSIFQQVGPDHYQLVTKISTAAGARTALFVSELNRLYLAVPHRGSQRAEVRVYEAQP